MGEVRGDFLPEPRPGTTFLEGSLLDWIDPSARAGASPEPGPGIRPGFGAKKGTLILSRPSIWLLALLLTPLSSTQLSALPDPVSPQTLIGAKAVLAQIAAGSETPKASDTPLDRLRRDLEEFQKQAPDLGPDKAAKKWGELAQRTLRAKLSRSYGLGPKPRELRYLIRLLPGPKSWRDLRKQPPRPEGSFPKQATFDQAWSFFFDLLEGNGEAVKHQSLRWKKQGLVDPEFAYLRYPAQRLSQSLGLGSDGDDDLEAFHTVLDHLSGKSPANTPPPELNFVRIPLGLLERPEAEVRAAFRQLFTSEKIDLDRLGIPEDPGLRGLAAAAALEVVDSLSKPLWQLCLGPDSFALFQALRARFPFPEIPEDADERQVGFLEERRKADARTWLAQWMYATAREDGITQAEIRKLLTKWGNSFSSEGFFFEQIFRELPESGLEELERAGAEAAFFHQIATLLQEAPELPLWEALTQLGLLAGEELAAAKLLEGRLASSELLEKDRIGIENQWMRIHFARGRPEEVAARVEARRSSKLEGASLDWMRSTLWERWLKAGHLYGKPRWKTQALEELMAAFRKNLEVSSSPDGRAFGLAQLFQKVDEPARAEEVLLGALRIPRKPNPYGYGQDSKRPLWLELAALYHRQGRPSDVLTLLQEVPDWDASDLVELPMTVARLGKRSLPLGCMAGRALAQAGETEAAQRVLEWTLFHHRGNDPSYEAYVELMGAKALPFLKELAQRDAFEERPWIWQARIHLDQGNPALAQTLLEEAIRMDPSDGEQGPGDRLRAYLYLSEARRAQGDDAAAELYGSAVRAIRLGETADTYYEAGLTQKALEIYEEALGIFSDAYCIRSRLAVRAREVGSLEKARVHYRRAFELMPVSFGRIESHCFGCEGVFRGPLAESIAEEVLSQDRSKESPRAQDEYLLGYLRNLQDRTQEAAKRFQEASGQDPKYLNAWLKLLQLPKGVSPSIQGQASVQLVSLDPYGFHRKNSPLKGIGLEGLWKTWRERRDQDREPPQKLLDLPQSREKLQGLSPEAMLQLERQSQFQHTIDPYRVALPGKMLENHDLVEQVLDLWTLLWPSSP